MTIQEQLERAGITAPMPDDVDFFRLELSPIKTPLVVIGMLEAIYQNTSYGVDSHDDKVPVAVPVNVTENETLLAAPSAKPRKIGVFNNGSKDLILLEGSSHPGFAGQNNGDGLLGEDFGILVGPGDYFESPVAHRGPVRARARDDQSSITTVTNY